MVIRNTTEGMDRERKVGNVTSVWGMAGASRGPVQESASLVYCSTIDILKFLIMSNKKPNIFIRSQTLQVM